MGKNRRSGVHKAALQQPHSGGAQRKAQHKAAHYVPYMMYPGEHPQTADEQGNAHLAAYPRPEGGKKSSHPAASTAALSAWREGMECPRLSFATSGVKPGCS